MSTTIYNQTSLKKIHKMEIIRMFLEQQTEKNKLISSLQNKRGDVANLYVENLELKKELEYFTKNPDICVCCHQHFNYRESYQNADAKTLENYTKYIGTPDWASGDMCVACINITD